MFELFPHYFTVKFTRSLFRRAVLDLERENIINKKKTPHQMVEISFLQLFIDVSGNPEESAKIFIVKRITKKQQQQWFRIIFIP